MTTATQTKQAQAHVSKLVASYRHNSEIKTEFNQQRAELLSQQIEAVVDAYAIIGVTVEVK